MRWPLLLLAVATTSCTASRTALPPGSSLSAGERHPAVKVQERCFEDYYYPRSAARRHNRFMRAMPFHAILPYLDLHRKQSWEYVVGANADVCSTSTGREEYIRHLEAVTGSSMFAFVDRTLVAARDGCVQDRELLGHLPQVVEAWKWLPSGLDAMEEQAAFVRYACQAATLAEERCGMPLPRVCRGVEPEYPYWYQLRLKHQLEEQE